jgi:RNA recognition motif-containing protein
MNNRLYVGNLAFHTTEGELQRTFSQFGTVSEVALVLDRETGRSRGFAFVAMATDQDANNAMTNLNGADLDGRTLKVNIAEERRPKPSGSFGGGRERRY